MFCFGPVLRLCGDFKETLIYSNQRESILLPALILWCFPAPPRSGGALISFSLALPAEPGLMGFAGFFCFWEYGIIEVVERQEHRG